MPETKRGQLMTGLFVAAAVICWGGAANAENEVLDYHVGFEPPAFPPGPIPWLPGIEGWIADGPAEVSSDIPHTGAQSIEVPGSGLSLSGSPHSSTIGTHLYGPVQFFQNASIIEWHAFVRLDGPSTDTGNGSADNLISANIELNELGLADDNCNTAFESALLSSSEEVWITHEGEYVAGVPVTLHAYHRITQRFDLAAEKLIYFLDGVQIAVLPPNIPDYCNIPMAEWPLHPMYLAMSLEVVGLEPGLTGYDPSAYTAYFDDVSAVGYQKMPIDILPYKCRNLLNFDKPGKVKAVMIGTEGVVVEDIDAESVRLDLSGGIEGIAPLSWTIRDIEAPAEPVVDADDVGSCPVPGPDGRQDLVLTFDKSALENLLGNARDGGRVKLKLIGKKKLELGATPILGEDFALVLDADSRASRDDEQ